MTIKEILSDIKFDKIAFYFEQNDFSKISDLENFNFDYLYFIPGVDELVVQEVIAILQTTHIEEESETIVNELLEQEVSEDSEVSLSDQIKKSIALLQIVISLKEINPQFDDVLNVLCKKNSSGQRELLMDIFGEIKQHENRNRFTSSQLAVLASMKVGDTFANVTMGNKKCTGPFINYCLANSMTDLSHLIDFDFNSEKIKGSSSSSMSAIKVFYYDILDKVLDNKIALGKAVSDVDYRAELYEKWASLNSNQLQCICSISGGKTLQAIAEEVGITRERVRQIVLKVCRILRPPIIGIAKKMFKHNSSYFTYQEIVKFLESEELAGVYSYIVEESDECRYLKFAEKYCSNELPDNYESLLCDLATNIIGDGCNYFDKIYEVEEGLKREGMPMLDFVDFNSFLLSGGYKMYGDFIVRGRNAYTLICYDAISKYFPNGIKLDSNADNADLAKMRIIVQKKYGHYELTENNRALTARISTLLVLCGRGQYIVPEKVLYSDSLMHEIIEYINNYPDATVYFDDVFKRFRGRLLMESNITNYHYLHGVLKYLFPDSYSYDRDKIIKNGQVRVSLDDHISDIIKVAEGPVTRAEIEEKCPFATGVRLANSVYRNPDIICWAYNEFNHSAYLSITSQDRGKIERILTSIFDQNHGYCNARQLYECVLCEIPSFIEINKITEELNLYYIVEYMFGSRYRFARPHIVSEDFPDIELTNINIGRFFVGEREKISYEEILSIAQRYYWAKSMLPNVICEMEDEYVRVNEDDYVKKTTIDLDGIALSNIRQVIKVNMGNSDCVALFAAFGYSDYPRIGYEWNEFLLDSIINWLDIGYRIINPMSRDRRYKRGIIVPKESSYKTFEDIVVSVLVSKDIYKVTYSELSVLLRNENLILNNVPQDLYNGDRIFCKDNLFILK